MFFNIQENRPADIICKTKKFNNKYKIENISCIKRADNS